MHKLHIELLDTINDLKQNVKDLKDKVPPKVVLNRNGELRKNVSALQKEASSFSGGVYQRLLV